MFSSDLIPLYSALAGMLGVIVASVLSYRIQKSKLKQEYETQAESQREQRDKLNQEYEAQTNRLAKEFATEDSIESAIRHFLDLSELPFRSFPMIRHHIGGFEANELRIHLVRSGAVRFMAADGTEM